MSVFVSMWSGLIKTLFEPLTVLVGAILTTTLVDLEQQAEEIRREVFPNGQSRFQPLGHLQGLQHRLLLYHRWMRSRLLSQLMRSKQQKLLTVE